MIMAIAAILAANVSAKEEKNEHFDGKKLSKEERVERRIQRLTDELFLSDKQAEKFAETYREYAEELDKLHQKKACPEKEEGKELSDKELDKIAKQRFENMKKFADLQEKFYDKFRTNLNARQTQKVLRFNDCCGNKAHSKGDAKKFEKRDKHNRDLNKRDHHGAKK